MSSGRGAHRASDKEPGGAARTIANALTLSRALLAPLILIALIGDIRGGAGLALLLTVIAMVTDVLDGAIARRYQVESRFGKVADPFTDALVFVAIFAGLAVRGVLPFWLPVLIAAREAAMHAVVRPALLRAQIDAGARPAGKLKTVLQAAAAIAVLLILLLAPEQARAVAVPLVGAVAIVSIVSLYWYVEPIAAHRKWKVLRISIVATCLSLWLLQIVMVAVAAEFGVAAGAGLFALIHTGLAGMLIFLLLKRRADFTIVDDSVDESIDRPVVGPPLPRINPSNVLTLARLTSIPTVLFLIAAAAHRAAPAWPVLSMLVVMMLTDVADGALARRRKQVTRIGAYLDSSTDYLLLGAVAILSLAYGIGTPWLFAVLIGRLAVQAVAVLWIVLAGWPMPKATGWGKASIAFGMVLLLVAVALGEWLPPEGIARLLRMLVEMGFAVVLIASAFEKVRLLILAIRRSGTRRAEPGVETKDPPGGPEPGHAHGQQT